jgi:addiction module HigA family antidote
MFTRTIDRIPNPTPPGEILLEEWLTPSGMSQSALAAKMGVEVQVINGIIRGRRAVTAHTAILLARALGTTAEFWMNAQTACDLWNESQRMQKDTAHRPVRKAK